ncbi:MAG: SdpI family protein [Isosphaeraceae bacterium]
MPDLTPWFLWLFVGATTLLMAISVPLMKGWVKPNRIYGVRTPKTLRDERVWYLSNAYGGRLLFRVGLLQLVAVVVLFFVPPLRRDFVAYNQVCGVLILGGILTAAGFTLRHVQSL